MNNSAIAEDPEIIEDSIEFDSSFNNGNNNKIELVCYELARDDNKFEWIDLTESAIEKHQNSYSGFLCQFIKYIKDNLSKFTNKKITVDHPTFNPFNLKILRTGSVDSYENAKNILSKIFIEEFKKQGNGLIDHINVIDYTYNQREMTINYEIILGTCCPQTPLPE